MFRQIREEKRSRPFKTRKFQMVLCAYVSLIYLILQVDKADFYQQNIMSSTAAPVCGRVLFYFL